MIIDCDSCVARDVACHDCVVGVLLGTPSVPVRGAGPGAAGGREPAGPGEPLPLEFGPVERRALDVLAEHGLIPRLRLVPRPDEPAAGPGDGRDRGGRGAAGRRDVG